MAGVIWEFGVVPGLGSGGLVQFVFLLGFPESGPVGIRWELRGGAVHSWRRRGRGKGIGCRLAITGRRILTRTAEIMRVWDLHV